MQAKLIKQKGIGIQTGDGNDYFLTVNEKTYHTNPITQGLGEFGKLSYKNCQAIERGWDLIEEMCKLVDKKAEQSNTIDLNAYGQGCLDAFQKAIEILGDKKFSEEDMRNAYLEGANQALDFNPDSVIDENKYIQSLQQTEWDVEIEMKDTREPKLANWTVKIGGPKLDADGCLILKRV